MAAQSRCRDTFSGDPALLAQLLAPHVAKRRWLSYGERLDKSKVEAKTIVAFAPLLNALLPLQRNLSFPQTKVVAALKIVLGEKREEWGIGEGSVHDWLETSAKRLRTLCRHLYKIMCKPEKPKMV